VCPNQSLCAEFDVLRRSRVLEGNERSALSYARAIAVSVISLTFQRALSLRVRQAIKGARTHVPAPEVHLLTVYLAFPRLITESERGEVQKLPFIGTKVSNMVGCARSDRDASAYYG
jgi:hypothetical protein